MNKIKDDTESNKKIQNILLAWHSKNMRNFPWRDNPEIYSVFLAEFLLQKTPVERVAMNFEKLLKSYPNVCAISRTEIKDLLIDFKYIGLKKRILWLREASEIICKEYDGNIPQNKEVLLSLPGIGQYTASAIRSFGFDISEPIIDTNVIRFLSRLYCLNNQSKYKLKKEVEIKLKEIFPKKLGKNFNEALLDFPALVCKTNPECSNCPLQKQCSYYLKHVYM